MCIHISVLCSNKTHVIIQSLYCYIIWRKFMIWLLMKVYKFKGSAYTQKKKKLRETNCFEYSKDWNEKLNNCFMIVKHTKDNRQQAEPVWKMNLVHRNWWYIALMLSIIMVRGLTMILGVEFFSSFWLPDVWINYKFIQSYYGVL